MKVAVVAETEVAREFLQRRVGGVLKNIATVIPVLETDLPGKRLDLVIVHHLGGRTKELQSKLKHIPVINVELSLITSAVKSLIMTIKPNETVAVLADHQRCANKLLSEIISAGVVNCQFITGTFELMHGIKANRYVTSEEMAEGIPDKFKENPNMVVVPRMVSQESSVKLISIALEFTSHNQGVKSLVNFK